MVSLRGVASSGRAGLLTLPAAASFLALCLAGCGAVRVGHSGARRAPARRSAYVESAQLVTRTDGWALTRRALSLTRDRGTTWREATPPRVDPRAIEAVSFLDAKRGWAETWSRHGVAEVYRTTDGGHSWASSRLPASYPDGVGPVSVDFVDRSRGWVCVQKPSSSAFSVGDLFRTNDGGATWTKLAVPVAGTIHFVTGSVGWLAGGVAGVRLYETRDGGASWTRRAVGRSSSANDETPVFFTRARGVLPVTLTPYGGNARMAFYATRNGGRSWRRVAAFGLREGLGQGTPATVAAPSRDEWLTFDAKRIVAVRDGGAEVETIPRAGLPAGILAAGFADDETGWAVRRLSGCRHGKADCFERSTLYATADGARTWRELSPP